MEPERIRPGEANSRMIESEVTDFPEPDSPTMPTVSPCWREKLTSFTAVNVPSSEGNSVMRWATWSKGSICAKLADLRILR